MNNASSDGLNLLQAITASTEDPGQTTFSGTTGAGTRVTLNDTLATQNACGLDLSKAELPIILISTLVVNLVALAVLLRMRGTCDTLDHYLISLLNFNDLMTTAIYTFTWVTGWASCDRLLHMSLYCGVLGWLATSLTVWSAGIIIVMTTCRYLSLVKPLYYRAKVTTSTVFTGAVSTLVICLVFFIFPFTGLTAPFKIYNENHVCAIDFAPGLPPGPGQRVFIGCIGAIGCLTVVHVVVCNSVILIRLRQRNAIHDLRYSNTTGPTRTNSDGKRRVFGHVTLVVSFVYAMCYAPFVGRLMVDTVHNLDNQDGLIHTVSMCLLFLSPLLNPIVYGVFNKQFRKTLFTMFKLPVKMENHRSSTYDPEVARDGRTYLQTGDLSRCQERTGGSSVSSGLSGRGRGGIRGLRVHSRCTELTKSGTLGSVNVFIVQSNSDM